ncbi:hypothetical protein OG225_15785 [Nocardia sp. NBC_01377]|uniref:hypothetical protein n=1 Tax=Nocardia sp. NBC_01377 TaxID=2903595 RepID=UPI0032432AFC
MFRTGIRRVALSSAAAFSLIILGGTVGAAAPTLTADVREEGTIALGSNPEGKPGTACSSVPPPKRECESIMAATGESRGDVRRAGNRLDHRRHLARQRGLTATATEWRRAIP